MTKGEALKMMQAFKAHMTTYGIPTWDVREIGEAFGMAIEALEQPEPRWIPCSERLPEESGNYLVTAMCKGRPEIDMDYWQFDCMWDDWGDEVIAWMPLPEPWRGEEHETD